MTIILIAINGNTASATSLNCTFNILIPVAVGEIYHCNGKRIGTGNDEILVSVNGIHLPGKRNGDVKGLTVSNNLLAFIPVNIDEFFPNILYLDFSLNQISFVNSSHLIPFPNLIRLNLNSNKMVQLESKLFSGSRSIKFINLSNNHIRHVGHDFILPGSGEVLFSNNPCIDKSAVNAEQIVALRFSLLLLCPPTISQIEATLESRTNFITKVDSQVQGLELRTDSLEQSQSEINTEFQIVKARLSYVYSQLGSLIMVTDSLAQNNSKMDGDIKTLTSVLTNISSEMQNLVTKTYQLEVSLLELRLDGLTLASRVSNIQSQGQLLITRTDDLDQRVSIMNDQIETHRIWLRNVRNKNADLEKRVALLESSASENKLRIKGDENENH